MDADHLWLPRELNRSGECDALTCELGTDQ
jgi:hypothetical protein